MWPAVCTRRPVGPGCGDDARRDEGLLFEDDWNVGWNLKLCQKWSFCARKPMD